MGLLPALLEVCMIRVGTSAHPTVQAAAQSIEAEGRTLGANRRVGTRAHAD